KRIAIREARATTREKKADRAASGMAAEIVKAPKSQKARMIPIDEAVVAVFRRIKARQAEARLRLGAAYRDTGHVFTDASGAPSSLNGLTKAFREVANRAGLDHALSLHSLRHTAATWMLSSGADVLAVQQILGHAAASTTLNIYGHAVAEAKTRAAGLVAAALRVAVGGESGA
ncbi:MAG TPA: tyrosine-type recombinase/integrase, partial [Candidatus Aquilonibacter sp.]